MRLSPIFISFGFFAFLAIVYNCYYLGFAAPFQFDDFCNLSWLSELDDLIWLRAHVFSGMAGPSGRPIALASFLVDGYYWPFDSAPFHRTNTLLHLLNGCLLVVILERGRILCRHPPSVGLILFAASLWTTLPFLASTVMLSVQRMALLSATFSLAGIAVYLIGRCQLPTKARSGSVLMTAAVVVFTPLAVLSKENGALLPLYIAVVEATLLPPLPSNLSRLNKNGLRLLVALPVFALFGYLANMLFHLEGLQAAYGGREFSLSDRVQTESVIVWEYLRLAFVPQISELGPFQDAHPIYRITDQPLRVLGSSAAWLGLLISGWILRKSTPLLLFAVAWFLGGHLLESTIIPLELYFEHRNYLPLIGPVYSVTLGLGQLLNSSMLRSSVFATYLALQLCILAVTTSLWGDSLKSAYFWAENRPNSIRAAQFLAQQLMQSHRLSAAENALDQALTRHPRDAALILQKIQLRCEAQKLPETLLRQIQSSMPNLQYSSATAQTLNALIDLAAAKRCYFLRNAEIHLLLDGLLQNPGANGIRYHLHRLKARLYELDRRLSPAIRELEASLEIDPTLDTYLHIARILSEAGFYDTALNALFDAKEHLPNNPFVRRYWLRQLNSYTRQINGYRTITP